MLATTVQARPAIKNIWKDQWFNQVMKYVVEEDEKGIVMFILT